MLLYYQDRDTRTVAARLIEATGRKALIERYGSERYDVLWVGEADLVKHRQAGYSLFVASSFSYERFFRGARLRDQDPSVYELHRRYVKLFNTYHYTEIRPAHKTYLFSNPTIRIIDLDNPRRPVCVRSGEKTPTKIG